MKLLALYVNVAGENIVKDYILDKRALVVLFIVKALEIIESNREQKRSLFRRLVLTFNENKILRLRLTSYCAIGIAVIGENSRGVGVFITHVLSGLADSAELTAGNDNAVFIDYTDNAVDRVLHLMYYPLKQSVRHNFSLNIHSDEILITFLSFQVSSFL